MFGALVQVAFWRFHNPTQVSARPHPHHTAEGYLSWESRPSTGERPFWGDILCLKGGAQGPEGQTSLGLVQELPGKREQVWASDPPPPGPSALPSAGP